MTYALVIDQQITRVGHLPDSARRLDTGDWVLGLPDASTDVQQACGWYEVTDTPQDPPAGEQVTGSTVDLTDGIPTRVWAYGPNPEPTEADTARTEVGKVVVKARAVAAGTDTFTAAQVQKILAHLVLREAGDT